MPAYPADLLGGLSVPPMPPEVRAQISRALAAEAASRLARDRAGGVTAGD